MESKIQKAIMQYLKREKIYAVKVIVAARAGVPDIFVCIDGRFVAFEVKAPGNKPTALQEMNLTRIKASGGIACVVNDVQEVIEVVKFCRNK